VAFLAGYTYTAPASLPECFRLLEEIPGAMVFAGGTDALVKIRGGRLAPKMMVDIKGIESLGGIRHDGDGTLWIGPLATHNEITGSPVIQEKYPFLSDAARWVGSYQIRNRGTIGGNVCNGSPAAETLPSLFVLDARLHLESSRGKRVLPIDGFFCGPQKTCLEKGEILAAIEIPPVKGDYNGVYLRNARRSAVDIAMVTCAAFWREDSTTPTGRRYRIALGSVAPTVVRATRGEEYLNAVSHCSDDVVEEASRIVLDDISPIDDIRTSGDYRLDITSVLVKKAIGHLVCRKGVGRG
jgi:carbon-monoxide dehydrogenase medium subunit